MFEVLSTDVVLSLATIGVSLLAVIGTIKGLRSTQVEKDHIDVASFVETAPYQRLHSVNWHKK